MALDSGVHIISLEPEFDGGMIRKRADEATERDGNTSFLIRNLHDVIAKLHEEFVQSPKSQ